MVRHWISKAFMNEAMAPMRLVRRRLQTLPMLLSRKWPIAR